MRHPYLLLTGFALTLLAQPALQAQPPFTRTWVSVAGSDANPCTSAAPCRSFAGALLNTFINGEINVLDSGPFGFGQLTITKSITINGDGSLANTHAAGFPGVVIDIASNANDPKRRVHLRNLKINGTGINGTIGTATGITGIRFVSGTQLVVEDCLIQGFTQFGIDVNGPTNAQITVSNTTITDVGLSAIRIKDAGGTLRTHLRNLLIDKAGFGLDLTGGVATLEDSTITHVANQAVAAGGGSTLNVDGGVVSYNGTGVSALPGSTVRIANLAILNNNTGINAAGTVASFGGNKNAGNVVPGAPNANIPLQ